MGENYAVGVNQRTGKKEYYKTKKDYQTGRSRKQASANRRHSRVSGRVRG